MRTILSVKKLRKQFDDGKQKITNVLNDISFDVEEADFIAIMGPSGSGKSTLLYNISGMDQPSRLAVWISLQAVISFLKKKISVS